MPRTSKVFFIAACLLLLLGVQLGALGAHALNNILTPAQINSWELAVQYQLVHSLGLILIGLLLQKFGPSRLMVWSGSLMLAGIFLFSGSIYTSALGISLAAQVAPYGGTSFMVAWLLLAVAVYRCR
jgi:uncharacterized membrane protein YgdD (TMEM256/DUF423 family)